MTIIVGGQRAPIEQVEVLYLRRLVGQCNELAQATDMDVRPDLIEQHPPRLQHVYVDLDTTQAPSLEQAFGRLPLQQFSI